MEKNNLTLEDVRKKTKIGENEKYMYVNTNVESTAYLEYYFILLFNKTRWKHTRTD
jgi:hypothetical protein